MKKLLAVIIFMVNLTAANAQTEAGLNAWIQNSDTSIIDVKSDNSAEVIKAFNEFGWGTERDKRKQLGMDNSVDPSLGFGVWGDERFMNIIPKDDNKIEVLYVKTRTVSKKVLGFIPTESQVNDQFLGENLTQEQAEEIIRAYFAKDEAMILKFCKK